MISLRELLEEMVAKNASDLHLTAGLPPQFRIDGEIESSNFDVLTADDTRSLAYSVLNDEQKKIFENEKELDLSFGVQGLSRFRANVFLQRGVTTTAIRQIPYEIMGFEKLGLPKAVRRFAELPRGLVLVTGPTGSGKSTTLASIIDYINEHRANHILTIEDPIEYVHAHKKSMVNQRELHTDTDSFPNALKYVLRQDPDVILIGEMRDRETIAAALTIAETGHLALATLHTNSTYESINRIVDVFPENQQGQIRAQLAFVLEGVITQQLIPRHRTNGRALCAEVMVCTPAIKALIRDSKIHQIYGIMQAGQKYGMQTMNQSLYQAYTNRLISYDDALNRSADQDELLKMIGDTVQV
ncbi:MAG TPA: type IV pilus twitching motility protein PilT [Candidatus Krumholzibacteria bacterium]|nr:type IV pilus twitching motility protein PilT [Candidatus Krumholzibacteria bacterium]